MMKGSLLTTLAFLDNIQGLTKGMMLKPQIASLMTSVMVTKQ